VIKAPMHKSRLLEFLILQLRALLLGEAEPCDRKPKSVAFVVPLYVTKEGQLAAFTLPSDLTVTIPLVYKNAAGEIVAAIPGGSVAISDTAIASATMVDDGHVLIVPNAEGATLVTYTNGALTATLDFTVTAAAGGGGTPDTVPTSVDFDTANAVTAAKAGSTPAPTPNPSPEPVPAPAPVEPGPAPTPPTAAG
jgi:hypothetical protein